MAKSTSRVPGGKSLAQAKAASGVNDEFDPSPFQDDEDKESVKVEPKQNVFERTFTKTKKIISDVFKLEPAQVIKQVGTEKDIDKDPESFKGFEHCHIFRTFDSDGKRHAKCCSTAGHFHDIEWDYDKDGKPFVKSISGPMVTTRKQVRGKWVQVSSPANKYDDHTHDITYLQSHEVSARTTNIEAQKVIAFEAQKGANPGGVQERG